MKYAILAAAVVLSATAASAQDFDVAAGETVFKKCAVCHQVGPEAKNRVGPTLNGVVGREWGQVEGFRYSEGRDGTLMELAKEGRTWTVAELGPYLENPKSVIPRGKMAFAGLKSEEERMNVIAYLAQFDADGNTVDPAPVLEEHAGM